MKRLMLLATLVCALFLLIRCNGQATTTNKSITVTIPPLKGIVNQIVDEQYEINVLLPAGSSPETYSPTVSQLTAVSESAYVFSVGTLTFEQSLTKLLSQNANCQIVNTAKGAHLIEGECSHAHNEKSGHHHHEEAHHHSIDPHVWMSHSGLLKIIDNITAALVVGNPDSSRYISNAEQLKQTIRSQQARAKESFNNTPHGSFLIYHPALGYFAEEYGLEQISLENEGKNPTPKSLASVVEKVNKDKLNVLLYQQEYPKDVVKPIADILDVNLVEINPLSDDILSELDRVINIISTQDGK